MTITIFFVCLFTSVNVPEKPPMKVVHQLYQKSGLKEESCRKLIELLESFDEYEDPLLYGYKASATMIMAKHVSNPFSKLRYFKKGKEMLEDAIDARPGNVELRMLRLLVQSNIPDFLGYDDSIESDKTFIFNKISELKNEQLKNYIMTSLQESDIVIEQY